MLPVGEVRGRLRRGWSVGSSPRWAVRDLDGETSKIWKGVAPQRSGSQEELVAATGPDHHVSVLLQDDIRAVVEVEDRDGVELGGRTAGLGYCVWVDEVNQCLDDGVVGGVHVGVQREGALSLTVVGSIAFRCNDPVLPAKVSEADVQLMFLAGLPLVTAAVFCHTGHPQGRALRRHGHLHESRDGAGRRAVQRGAQPAVGGLQKRGRGPQVRLEGHLEH